MSSITEKITLEAKEKLNKHINTTKLTRLHFIPLMFVAAVTVKSKVKDLPVCSIESQLSVVSHASKFHSS